MGKDFSEVRWIVQTRAVQYNAILDVSRDSVRKVWYHILLCLPIRIIPT